MGLAALCGLLGVTLGFQLGRRSASGSVAALRSPGEATGDSSPRNSQPPQSAEIERLRAEVARLTSQLRPVAGQPAEPAPTHDTAALTAATLEQARLTALPKETLKALSAQIFDLMEVEFTVEGASALGLTPEQRRAGNIAAGQLEARLRALDAEYTTSRRQVGDRLEIVVGDHRAQTAAAFDAFEASLGQTWSAASLEWFRDTQYRERYAGDARDGRAVVYRLEPDPDLPGQYRFAAYEDPAATRPVGGYSSSSREFFVQRYGRLLGAPPSAPSDPTH